jgi:hypothetical protein
MIHEILEDALFSGSAVMSQFGKRIHWPIDLSSIAACGEFSARLQLNKANVFINGVD